MKTVCLTILFLTLSVFAGKFEDAEKLFQQGKFVECNQAIEELLRTNPNAVQKLKLEAMREYIWGNNPAKIAENVKKAQEIAKHHGWLTADLLNHSTLLIRRAEDWKSRGIPEYQELSTAAAKLLEQIKDGGNAEIAIKLVMLQTKNFNLNGEYQEPMRLIRQVLRFYYPTIRYSRYKKSSGEIQLLILLGEQYSGLGVRTNNEREKVNAISSAAKYYLQAANHIDAKSDQYRDLCDRLHYCRETLRLLGFKLRLPSKIKPQRSIAIAMIDEMLCTRRYHDVVLALEQTKNPVLRLRYAVALAGIDQFGKAIAVVNDLEIDEPHLLLNMAGSALAAGEKTDAAVFLKMFIDRVPNGPDTPGATQKYVGILVEQQKFEEGATAFLRLAALNDDAKQKSEAYYQAALCLYQAGKYRDCVALFDKISATPEQSLLLAQAKMKGKDFSGALQVLNNLLADKRLLEEKRSDVYKLAITCANEFDAKTAIALINRFLDKFPNTLEAMEYAKQQLSLYEKITADEKLYSKLALWCMKHHASHRDTVPLVLKCSKHIAKASDQETLLRNLLKQPDFSVAELNTLLHHLPTLALKREFLRRYQKPFDNTPELCELYFLSAETDLALKNYQTALSNLELLLKQQKVFKYQACKQMQAKAYIGLGKEPDARKAYQELLLTRLERQEKRKIVLELAHSWERDNNAQKAIATAWTAIPPDGKSTDANESQIIKNLLNLVIRNGEKLNSQPDIEDATEILSTLSSN